MKSRDLVAALVGAAVVIPVVAMGALTQDNSGMVVSYQGRLDRDGSPIDGSAVFQVRVFRTASGGTACYSPADIATQVFAGQFGFTLGPIPADCLQGAVGGLHLDISVKGPSDSGFTHLDGSTGARQRVLPVAMAMGTAPSSVFSVLGNIGIGLSSPTAALHVEQSWGTQATPREGLIYAHNTSNTAGSHASLALRTAGSGAGNPFVSFDVAGEAGWSAGMDNADNAFKIQPSWQGPGATPAALSISTGSDVSVRGSVGAGGNVTAAGTMSSTGNMTAPNFVGTNPPDYDSGWVAAGGNTTNTLAHNLGVFPRRINVWVRATSTAAFITPINAWYDEGSFTLNGPIYAVSTSQLLYRTRYRAVPYFHFDENGTYQEGDTTGGNVQYRFLLWK